MHGMAAGRDAGKDVISTRTCGHESGTSGHDGDRLSRGSQQIPGVQGGGLDERLVEGRCMGGDGVVLVVRRRLLLLLVVRMVVMVGMEGRLTRNRWGKGCQDLGFRDDGVHVLLLLVSLCLLLVMGVMVVVGGSGRRRVQSLIRGKASGRCMRTERLSILRLRLLLVKTQFEAGISRQPGLG